MDYLVAFIIVIRKILFCSGECRVVLDWPQASHPLLVLDGIEDFINGEPQQSVVLFHLEVLRWIRREDRERLSFVGWFPLVLVAGMDWSFVSQL